MSTATFIDIILAVILPPLGVFLRFGCEVEFWICLVLTFLGYIPGIIYAVYAITNCQGHSSLSSQLLLVSTFICNFIVTCGIGLM
ncbi:hypothetical protein Lal_00003916 [Lupinus albus]|nr:hypothetical protein Lal_00003916 [Lupinus albus]